MLRPIEAQSLLRFRLSRHPDLYIELPGVKEMGRMLVPDLIRKSLIGP